MNTNTRNYTNCRGNTEALTPVHEGHASKQPQYYRAPIDVHENEESFTIVADMPGSTADGIEISVEDNSLEITGKVQDRYSDLGRVLRGVWNQRFSSSFQDRRRHRRRS